MFKHGCSFGMFSAYTFGMHFSVNIQRFCLASHTRGHYSKKTTYNPLNLFWAEKLVMNTLCYCPAKYKEFYGVTHFWVTFSVLI